MRWMYTSEMIAEGEYFHIYNRGVDKRSIFEDEQDLRRFLMSMREFNTTVPVGGIYMASLKKRKESNLARHPIVSIVSYCLNKNHFHLILRPLTEKGGSLYMQRLCAGYTKYFNEKYSRSGALFQGKYKRVLIETNEQLLHVHAYVSVNDRAHRGLNPSWFDKVSFSSVGEYITNTTSNPLCEKAIILDQFSTIAKYNNFIESTLMDILERKKHQKDLSKICLE